MIATFDMTVGTPSGARNHSLPPGSGPVSAGPGPFLTVIAAELALAGGDPVEWHLRSAHDVLRRAFRTVESTARDVEPHARSVRDTSHATGRG